MLVPRNQVPHLRPTITIQVTAGVYMGNLLYHFGLVATKGNRLTEF